MDKEHRKWDPSYSRRDAEGKTETGGTKTVQTTCFSCGAMVTGYIAYNGHLHYKCDACGCSLIA